MIFNNISVRWISAITAMIVVVCFVTCYLVFKYLWTYDRHISQSLELQQEEVTRVETVIDITQEKMGDSMVDYAAWNDMANFIRYPTQEFIDNSVGLHALTSQVIDGFFIFNPNKELVWGKELDVENNALIDSDTYSPYFQTILAEAEQQSVDVVKAVVRFIVINNSPYLVATTRVCTSDADQCDKGYLIFFKRLSRQFEDMIQKATGIHVEILVESGREIEIKPVTNISYVLEVDYSGNSSVVIKVFHRVKLPSFIVWEEVYALLAFSIMFYFINLLLVQSLVKPVTNAIRVLEKFQLHGGKMPDESSFISKEMKKFARTINRIMIDLEQSHESLRWQSEHDSLTEISNRRHLERQLVSFIEEYHFKYLALFLVDIDYFKLYNDNLSHLDGDNVLKQVAKALDCVEYNGDKVVARFGGEEFCVVFASDIPLNIEMYAQKIKDAVAHLRIPHPCAPIKNHPYLSISIGGVHVENPSIKRYQEMFHQADIALYLAKDRGRNQYVVQNFNSKIESFIGVK
ncbi:sensor domain-containing diguanylate cyclase [Vibrio ziniensis]|uniref:diguanylate cyclase n=1 Tax=Vibrio ziniensis TaxID=2711221 RepID=A0A6G7CKB8_9VIBR|nr:diguanylate cyclase [Vibrio ziniensis]QIH42555.1 diguanylate cyclase [Vibrio ziniensis]